MTKETEETSVEREQAQQAPAPVKPKKAEIFRKSHPYSLTFYKLMKKWKCETPEAWRALRAKHKKEHFVGPKRERNKVKREVFKIDTSFNDRRGGGNWNNGPRRNSR